MKDKWYYIEKIRNYPSSDTDLLLDMMDEYGKYNILSITLDEAKEYWNNINKGE